MAMRTPLRCASRASRTLEAARTRPCLLSRLPNRQRTPAPFASVHTISHKTQEAAALRQDADAAAAAATATRTETAPEQASAPPADGPNRPARLYLENTRPMHPPGKNYILRLTSTKTNPGQYELRDRQTLDIRVGDEVRTFDAAYLRDRCPCPQCISPSSGNKSFSTAEIPTEIMIKDFKVRDDGSVRVLWLNDIPRAVAEEHFTVFPGKGPQSLLSIAEEPAVDYALRDRVQEVPNRVFWDAETLAPHLRKIDYADFVAGGAEFQQGVCDLSKVGLLFLTNVPQTETAVADIGLKFGALKETFYGRTWDVISKPDAENVAYTSAYLGLHSDMLYLDSPPRIQLLHCLENSCEGGESIFSDALHAASVLLRENPDAFKALERIKVPFHYNKNGFSYARMRHVVYRLKQDVGRAVDPMVWWSPPFQAPFRRPRTDFERKKWRQWHAAARAFQALIEDDAHVYQYKLQPGECVLFDNRRVLHGRRAFDTASGRRWLKGTYVGNDDFTSTLNSIPQEVIDAA